MLGRKTGLPWDETFTKGHPSPHCLAVGITRRGICRVDFRDRKTARNLLVGRRWTPRVNSWAPSYWLLMASEQWGEILHVQLKRASVPGCVLQGTPQRHGETGLLLGSPVKCFPIETKMQKVLANSAWIKDFVLQSPAPGLQEKP